MDLDPWTCRTNMRERVFLLVAHLTDPSNKSPGLRGSLKIPRLMSSILSSYQNHTDAFPRNDRDCLVRYNLYTSAFMQFSYWSISQLYVLCAPKQLEPQMASQCLHYETINETNKWKGHFTSPGLQRQQERKLQLKPHYTKWTQC